MIIKDTIFVFITKFFGLIYYY